MTALRLCILLISSGLCLLAQDTGITTLSAPPVDDNNNPTTNPAYSVERGTTPSPPILISRLSFFSAPGVSSTELNQIASIVERQQCPAEGFQNCVAERIRDAFQQFGYFKAVVQPPQVTFSRVDQSEAEAVAVVNPGLQYRLGQIEWTGKYAFPGLNNLLEIHAGDIFNISKARATLEQLRNFYAERGYINVSAVPDTQVNETSQTVNLTIDIDPGKQFRLRAIEVHGYPDTERPRQIMKLLDASGVKVGMPYNAKALQDFFENHAEILGSGASLDHNVALTTDNQHAFVTLSLLAHP